MNQFRRIQREFDAATREGAKAPLSDAPTVRETPGAQGALQMRPKSTNARSSTPPGPRSNTARIGSQPSLPEPTQARPEGEEILIAVMGVTGSGKSYFCRAATGDDGIVVGDGLESCNATDTPVKYIYTY